MSENAITRRSFLAGSAGVAALAAAGGYMSFGAWEQAYADEPENDQGSWSAYTMCNACSSKCGYKAYVKRGRLSKLIPSEHDANARGKICARGYGYPSFVYSEDRLTDPLKKNDKGEFEAISWEQAYQEIGEKVKAIIDANGPEALALVQDPRPSGEFYTKRFLDALGSPNYYTHGAACNLSKASGFAQVIGAGDFQSDIPNAKMIMYIGRSVADAIRPSHLQDLQAAHENGAKIVMVDPRCNNSTVFADEWLPINPGTDLAFILAMCNVLIRDGIYDKDYVAENVEGFDEFAAGIADHTPLWAEGVCGISAETIERLAHEFAQAAPAASIDAGWRGGFGNQYANSGETARALVIFNTLLGCWNKEGGALLTSGVSAGKLDETKFPPVPKVEAKKAGSEEYPLASAGMGVNIHAASLAKEGKIKGMFFYNSNMVAGYSNPAYMQECLDALELCVVVDVQMSETALCADYVLPECSYLERLEIPVFNGGKVPSVSLRDKVLDVIHPNTLPVDQIFSGLAEACGVGQYFPFTVEELADAQLKTVGLSLDELRKVGTVEFPEKAFVYGQTPKWKTPSGKIQFTSEACEKAGYSAAPVWVAPAVVPAGGSQFRLITGKQAIHSHTMTANCEALMSITQDYDLTRVWLNADRAAELGIKDGDEVELSNEKFTGRCHVKVTQRLNPTAVFMPSAYGCSSKDQHTAYGVGLRPTDFMDYQLERGYGSTMAHEVLVTVKKVGA